MGIRQPTKLRERVRQAAEAALEHGGSVGPLELLQAMLLLQPVHVEGWRKGAAHYTPLEPHIQGSREKLDQAYQFFLEWVRERGLEPVEASYTRAGVRGGEPLQVTVAGDEESERFFRTHYAPANLAPRKAERLKEKLNKAPDLVVFQMVSDRAECGECHAEIVRGEMLVVEKEQPLCLSCADLDHLDFLPSGDTALTRRARKHSPLSAVVVRFNRSRKRYERQGLLVTPAAIAQAEQECAADAPDRAARREKDVERRRQEDRELIDEMTQAILASYPHCPADEARRLAEHTAQRGSGRVGRSAAGRALDERALDLAVVAWIRHQHTNYDTLLMQGTPRLNAREMIREQIQACVRKWKHQGSA